MDVFILQNNGVERLFATGLNWGEVIEFQEQCRYTKPFGTGVKVVVRAETQAIFGFRTTGTELGVEDATRHSEMYIG
jgi:hypothetical protein